VRSVHESGQTFIDEVFQGIACQPGGRVGDGVAAVGDLSPRAAGGRLPGELAPGSRGREGDAASPAPGVPDQATADERADHRVVPVVPRAVLVPDHRCFDTSGVRFVVVCQVEAGIGGVEAVEYRRGKGRVAQEEIELSELVRPSTLPECPWAAATAVTSRSTRA
jgi:hypothetical protein